jgi:hypothetical protein
MPTTQEGISASAPMSVVAVVSGDYKSVDPTPVEFQTLGAASMRLGLNVTAASGGGGVTVTIEGYDPGSDTWFTVLASALKTTVAFTTLLVDARLAASANLIAQAPLPAIVRVKPVGSGTRTTLNYSITTELTK